MHCVGNLDKARDVMKAAIASIEKSELTDHNLVKVGSKGLIVSIVWAFQLYFKDPTMSVIYLVYQVYIYRAVYTARLSVSVA